MAPVSPNQHLQHTTFQDLNPHQRAQRTGVRLRPLYQLFAVQRQLEGAEHMGVQRLQQIRQASWYKHQMDVQSRSVREDVSRQVLRSGIQDQHMCMIGSVVTKNTPERSENGWEIF
jgi:hypothetical protein